MAAGNHGSFKSSTTATTPRDKATMNGSIHGGQSGRSSRSRRKPSRTYTGWVADKITKVVVWYLIITFAFRCPASQKELKDSSPRICKPYLQSKDYATPYLQPYYDQYLSPYVQHAQPYVDRFNEHVYKPGYNVYQQYGAPRIADAQVFGANQWEKTIRPQLLVLQKQSGKQYQAHLAPHVKKVQNVVQPYYDSVATSASDLWELELGPAYRKTRPYAEKVYLQGHEFAVNTALPQAQYVGGAAWSFWTRQIWPRVRVLYGENVEPQLMRITERLGRYKDGKKLEAEIKSFESASKLAEASFSASSAASSISSTVKEATASPSSAASQAATEPESTSDPKERFREDLKSWEHVCAKAVEEGAEDLKERVTEITDRQISNAEGTGNALVTQLDQTVEGVVNSVKARVLQIVGQMPEDATTEQIETANEDLVLAIRNAGQNVKHRAQAVREWRQSAVHETGDLVGKALQSTLETIDSIRELRLTEIGRKYAHSSLPHKEWSRYNDIKKATQTWRNDVEKAAHAHEGIRNTHTAFDDIEHIAMSIAEDAAKELGRLKQVGKWKIAAQDDSDDFTTKTVPPPVKKAKDQVVEKVAEASRAIFDEEPEQGGVESATSVAAEKASQAASSISEAVVGSSTGSVKSAASEASKRIVGSDSPASKASKSAKSIASAASSSVIGSEPGLSDTATMIASSASSAIIGSDSPASRASKSAESVASAASKVVAGSESNIYDTATDAASSVSSVAASASSHVADEPMTKSAGSKLSSILSAQKSNVDSASKSAGSVASEASKSGSSVVESLTGPSKSTDKISKSASSAASKVSSQVSSAASAASGAIPDAEAVAQAAEGAAHAATESSKKVLGGAMAQVLVEPREPIMEEDIIDAAKRSSSRIQSMASVAGDKSSELTKAVQDAIKAATKTQGAVESATSVASEQYESALAAASSVLFGTQNAVEKGSSVANEQYLSAVTAASYAIYGTPATAAPIAAASSAYDSAMTEASKQYDAVKSRISEKISGTPKPVHEEMLSSAESAYSAAIAAASDGYKSAFPTTTQNLYESISSVAASRLSEGVSAASDQYKSAKKAVGAEPTPVHQQYLASAQKAYYEALGVAHGRYSEFLDAASSVVGATPSPKSPSDQLYHAMSGARDGYSSYLDDARSRYSQMVSIASDAAKAQGHKSIPSDALENLQGQMADASSIAISRLAAASSEVSAAVYGTPAPVTESLASRASENWESLVSKASEQVYGPPPPFTDVAVSRANGFVAQANEAASTQWDAVQSIFSELVVGKEPSFTESVYSRLQSAYSTGAPAMMSRASSYASNAYESATSVVSAVFVPPTQVPGIVEQMQEQINAAVDAASTQVYGTSKGTVEQATEAAASMYSDAASKASEAVYGRETNYLVAARSNVADIVASASSAIHGAIYGSPTGTAEAASSAAASVYSSIASQASQQASAASSAVSSAIYGEEQTYLEGVQSQLSVAMASAQSRLEEIAVQASKGAADAYTSAGSAASQAASSIVSAASTATERARDEL
ncbi:Hypothetical predicted protein [Lecanosticta acicola]|uniref:Uncharacterized protein n=1 Tax=Lecanosticta acicola TaxID=111012 RepID=A0AAI9ECG0_9PEZI|nr:Hypothetical predicted protein [Lecanosticta acicola]